MGVVVMVVAPLLLVALVSLVVRATAPAPKGGRRAIASAVLGTEVVASLGLVLVAAQLGTGGELLCPSDATCRAPSSLFALVAAPITFVATRFVMLVVVGSLYRIDVPRP